MKVLSASWRRLDFLEVVMSLSDLHKLAQGIEAIVTALGILGAGVWAWFNYWQRRERYPRAGVSHSTNLLRESGYSILRVAAKVTNSGDVLVGVRAVRTWLQQLSPVPSTIATAVTSGADPVQGDACEFDWPLLGERVWTIAEGMSEIEPGESEVFWSDFAIPDHVKQVLVYTFVSNEAKMDVGVGCWRRISVYRWSW
ncbi:MAG: hypothetical protein Q8O42_10120 [Acidobacteriota bacterium]|nr:hypothetical protein [Acidobacteriota bacterium]